ncbi:S-adenosyl-L-methionine-dependent methyltransferase [Cristinia sonorae]|uniref:rRNA adenine N(6)-methyltransferase n=1 Tax=Cristinia sonorae TaxID=1940300 RepID=A0A8K0UF13_9AGAR|nr:S-adenosyl-L-methionine-dependent methyltransferase [Cristinia sonorae]
MAYPRTKYASDSQFYSLPPLDEWRTTFSPHTVAERDRVSIRNPESALTLANSYLSDKSIAAGDEKVIIEAFPGPGQLSRALLQLPSSKVKKLVILEDHEPYLRYLRPLADADPRVTVIPLSGFDWSTYSVLEERGILDEIQTHTWDGGVHPQLHFVCHIPHTIKGEQLVAQLFRCIPTKSWLFKYGRVPMSLILGQWMWERVTAPVGLNSRCKVGVIAEASALLQNSVRPSALLPYDLHFHPTASKGAHKSKRPESRRSGQPLVSVNIVPLQEQVIRPDNLETWDYVLRRLFVLKNTALERAIGSLAVGATSLLEKLTSEDLPPHERLDTSRRIKDLTVAEWALIIRAFEDWPFAPTIDDMAISGSFLRDEKRKR